MIRFVHIKKYKEHLKSDHKENKLVSHANQFQVELNMIKPTTKKPLPIEIFTSFSVEETMLTNEALQIGTKTLNRLIGATQKTVTVGIKNQLRSNKYVQIVKNKEEKEDDESTYNHSNTKPKEGIGELELLDKSTLDYFLKINDVNILPTDGTILLEREYYFSIKGYALNKAWDRKEEVEGDFIIDTITAITYDTSSETDAEFQITFKEIL